jgi:hypothetical protein
MIRFNAVDAATEGFRVTREHPLTLLAWGLVMLVVNVGLQAWLLASGFGPDAMTAPAANLSPEEAIQRVRTLIPFVGVALLVGVPMNVLLVTAVIRAVLEPAQSRLAYLRVGADELRQLGLLLLILLVSFVYIVALEIGTILALAALSAVAGGVAGGLLKAAVVVAAVIALLYPAVRLSLAPAMTFADRRISLFRSWAMTRGQFWGLFGAYVLAAILALLVSLLALLIVGAVAAAAGLLSHGAIDLVSVATRRAPMTLEGLFAPSMLLFAVLNAGLTALFFTIVATPAPAAFRMLSGRAGEPGR